MKRKIVLGLVVHTLVFLAAGAYLAFKIHTATGEMERLLTLHDVELLREDFLVRLHAVQASLARGDRHRLPASRPIEEDVAQLERSITGCFACHHSDLANARLTGLRQGTEAFRASLTEAREGPPAAADAAFEQGEDLVGQVFQMLQVTHARLDAHTLKATKDVARTKYVAYALVLFGPLLSALMGWFAIGGLTRPLYALREATHRLERGDLEHRVEGLKDEFAELEASFNAMASSLQDQVQLMQRTEQLVVVGELAAGLVHEIKNPLAGIKAAVQVLSQEANVSDEDRAVLTRVGREVIGLECLLKGFLEFARPAKPRLADVDVNAFVESTAAFYLRSHTEAPGRPLRIVKALVPVPAARADPMQLQQILLNLLLNAVDAMPEGGTVEVRTRCMGQDAVCVEIADTGRGIRPEHVEEIFKPFFTTKPGGTGLGLAVSRRLAEQHGGTLSFGANPAGGSTFRICLPRSAPGETGRAA